MKILSISGMVPEQVCDTVRFHGFSGERNIAHYCGYLSDFISQVRADPSIDGAVFPRSCDSSRIAVSYLEDCGKFCYRLPVPARRDESAVLFYSEAIRAYKKAVEDYYQLTIGDLRERVQLVNERNRKLRQVYEELETLSYGSYLRKIHAMLKKPLQEQRVPSGWEKTAGGGIRKRVYLVGSFLSNSRLADAVESAGLQVVGDNLPESGRLAYRPDVPVDGDVFTGIARSILSGRMSPTQNQFNSILRADLEEIRKKKASGVIFITQKYCEPYDYLYPVYRKALEDVGLPSLRVVLDNSEETVRAELALGTFAEIL